MLAIFINSRLAKGLSGVLGGNQMKHYFRSTLAAVGLAAAIGMSGCATTAPNAVEKISTAPLYTSAVPTDAQFTALLTAVSVDRDDFIKRHKIGQRIESGLDIATLVAGVFAAYSTAYTDSVDLKEAAFSAASILTARSFLDPKGKNDAASQARRRLSCVLREARPFIGSIQPILETNFTSKVNNQITNRTTSISDEKNAFDALNTGMPDGFDSSWGSFNALDSATQQFFFETQQALLGMQVMQAERIAQEENTLMFENSMATDLKNAANEIKESEEDIYEQRYLIVIDTYMEIISAFLSAVDKDAPTYDSIVTSYAEALKTSEEQNMKAEFANTNTTALLAASGAMSSLSKPAVIATPYSTAAQRVKGCALAN